MIPLCGRIIVEIVTSSLAQQLFFFFVYLHISKKVTLVSAFYFKRQRLRDLYIVSVNCYTAT